MRLGEALAESGAAADLEAGVQPSFDLGFDPAYGVRAKLHWTRKGRIEPWGFWGELVVDARTGKCDARLYLAATQDAQWSGQGGSGLSHVNLKGRRGVPA